MLQQGDQPRPSHGGPAGTGGYRGSRVFMRSSTKHRSVGRRAMMPSSGQPPPPGRGASVDFSDQTVETAAAATGFTPGADGLPTSYRPPPSAATASLLPHATGGRCTPPFRPHAGAYSWRTKSSTARPRPHPDAASLGSAALIRSGVESSAAPSPASPRRRLPCVPPRPGSRSPKLGAAGAPGLPVASSSSLAERTPAPPAIVPCSRNTRLAVLFLGVNPTDLYGRTHRL